MQHLRPLPNMGHNEQFPFVSKSKTETRSAVRSVPIKRDTIDSLGWISLSQNVQRKIVEGNKKKTYNYVGMFEAFPLNERTSKLTQLRLLLANVSEWSAPDATATGRSISLRPLLTECVDQSIRSIDCFDRSITLHPDRPRVITENESSVRHSAPFFRLRWDENEDGLLGWMHFKNRHPRSFNYRAGSRSRF